MNPKQKLANPGFIIAVLLLVLNDWYFKQTFSNDLTGKLSDFAGLFAFPFLLSALFPRRLVLIYFLTFLCFAVWKTPLAQPFINSLNSLGLPVTRVVDYTDYIALIILPFSFYVFNRQTDYPLKPVVLNTIIVFSSMAFMATSMPKGNYTKFVYTDKTYTFNFSKRELVSRVNMLQLEYVHDVNSYGNGKVDFDSKTNIFYYREKKDTVAMMLDYDKINATDTVFLRTLFANINISGNETSSQIKLINLKTFVRKAYKGDSKAKTLKFFEKYVIKRIERYK